ncbi:MAG: PEP-CTERM sorting domain-containing protein [Verrucomicrobiota bacterium]
MKITNFLLSCATLSALSATASAAVITYTKTGFLSGSLGGTSFTNAAVTIRTTADTANVQYQLNDDTPFWTNAGVTSIDIDGFATATFNGSNVVGVLTVSNPSFSFTQLGIVELTNSYTILSNVYQPAEPNYALDTEIFMSSIPPQGELQAHTDDDVAFSTNLGDLILSSASGNSTFTSTLVPAPSALVLFGLSTFCFITRRRRTA